MGMTPLTTPVQVAKSATLRTTGSLAMTTLTRRKQHGAGTFIATFPSQMVNLKTCQVSVGTRL
jgi:hypothetical protein